MWPGTELLGTPLQRDPKLGTRALLTDAEYAQREARAKRADEGVEQKYDKLDGPVSTGSPIWWLEHGKPTRQASLIVEPPDGRIPPLTPEAIKLGEARDAKFHLTYGVERKVHGSNESWIDDVLALVEPYESNIYDRCISRGVIGSILPGEPGGYNHGNQIIQAPGLVVIRYEMIHEARVIPLDGRPHVGSGVRTYMGDPRGHWEGNTLVVETTNFLGGKLGLLSNGAGTPYSDDLVITERFTRVAPDTINYEALLNDPRTYTKPWKIAFPLHREPELPDGGVWLSRRKLRAKRHPARILRGAESRGRRLKSDQMRLMQLRYPMLARPARPFAPAFFLVRYRSARITLLRLNSMLKSPCDWRARSPRWSGSTPRLDPYRCGGPRR